MDGVPKSMVQKRARHYNETKSLIALSFIIFGTCFAFSLILLWPQSLLVTIFNSRLAYKVILDNEDYYTCDKDFISFVVDEPTADYAMLSFYVFNYSNAYEVMESGDLPVATETGPYGFVKNSYRYDVVFPGNDSTTLVYKEFSYLTPVTDGNICEAMFYRLQSDYGSDSPCSGTTCQCKDIDSIITIINPLFLRLQYEETPYNLLAHWSVEVYQTIKDYLNEPFTEAVKAHLVSEALKEIYYFRLHMHAGDIFLTAYQTLLSYNYTIQEMATWKSVPVSKCGLSIYGINQCPFTPYVTFQSLKNSSLGDSNYPSLSFLFNASNDFALVNTSYGLPRWMGLVWLYGLIEVNSEKGYTMANTSDLQVTKEEFILKLGQVAFQTETLTSAQETGCNIVIKSMATWLAKFYLSPYRFSVNNIDRLYNEINTTYTPVICAPFGERCIYQYGYLQYHAGYSLFPLNKTLIYAIFDVATEVNTEWNNLYKDVNAPRWYNVYLYYHHIYLHNNENNENDYKYLNCTNYGDTITDATYKQPAALYGSYHGVNAVNTTLLYNLYKKATTEEKEIFFNLATNISILAYDIYRNTSNFHDMFTIRYINKYKDTNLSHIFTIDDFSELGIAQWAGGFITDALASVRSVKMFNRNGMWNFGLLKYYNYYYEYAAYAILQGFPYAWIYNLTEARQLLNLLAQNDTNGFEFRRHIMYRGSTLIGDGSYYVNKIGTKGEVAFTRESNFADFSCDENVNNAMVCNIINEKVNSSAAQCAQVQALYTTCEYQSTFADNAWIDVDNCVEFETSTTSSGTGVQCDSDEVYGHTHPYLKSRGNVIFQMIYSMTIKIILWDNLWCTPSYVNIEAGININNKCTYDKGGLFTTTTLKKLLFYGYHDASLLKYLDHKYSLNYNISLECVNHAYDLCGVKQYRCDEQGVKLIFPSTTTSTSTSTSTTTSTTTTTTTTKQQFISRYNVTKMDEYFAPYFIVTNTGLMLWPYSMNNTKAKIAQNIIANLSQQGNTFQMVYEGFNITSTEESTNNYQLYYHDYLMYYSNITSFVQLSNIIWSAFPAWNDYNEQQQENKAFLQYYQCQNRILFGNINQFTNCEYTLSTGRDEYNKLMILLKYYGNHTIYPFYNTNYTTSFNTSSSTSTTTTIDFTHLQEVNPMKVQDIINGSILNNQYQSFLYKGFNDYPYSYNGLSKGIQYDSMISPTIFNKIFGLSFTMSQEELDFAFQRDLSLTAPFSTGSITTTETITKQFPLSGRRFTEAMSSWTKYRNRARPLDVNGMPYTIPKAFASIQSLTNFPVFIETPNSYGNALWGGVEYALIRGTTQNEYAQRTFIDYDPVSGRAYRAAIRNQVSIRVDANALLQNLISSQSRCTPPSKAFAQSSGYGCFAYIPLLWIEDARVIDKATLYQFYDHYYTRPARGQTLTVAGIAIGAILVVLGACFYFSEAYRSRRFYSRVYVD